MKEVVPAHSRESEDVSPEQLAAWFAAAERGDPESQLRVGICYLLGTRVPADAELASRFVQAAALQGLADAERLLGWMHWKGRGLDQDYGAAVQWWTRASEQGDPRAKYYLARALWAGRGIPMDRWKSLQHLWAALENEEVWVDLSRSASPRTMKGRFLTLARLTAGLGKDMLRRLAGRMAGHTSREG